MKSKNSRQTKPRPRQSPVAPAPAPQVASGAEPFRRSAPYVGSIGYTWAGFVAVILGIVFLELVSFLPVPRHYFFVQDDVAVLEFPSLLWQLRNIVDHGIWATYNPFTNLGSPCGHAGGGVTYPFTLVAYLFSRYVLRNEFATMDVLAIGHLIATYFAVYCTLVRMGCSRGVSSLAGVSVALGGPTLLIGRCWHSFVPIPLYMTLLVRSVLILKGRAPNARWAFETALAIGLFYHVGFPQTWFYGLLFYVFAVIWLFLFRSISFIRAAAAAGATMMGIGISWPVIAMQRELTKGFLFTESYGEGVGELLPGLIFPVGIFGGFHPNLWGSFYPDYSSEMMFFGALFVVFSIFSIFAAIASPFYLKRRVLADRVWLVCGMVAIWLSLGNAGYLWKLVSMVPVIGGLNNHPFRLLPFVMVFLVVAGAVWLDRALRMIQRRAAWELAIFSIGVCILGYHVTCCRSAFYTYLFTPYPALPQEVTSRLGNKEAGALQRFVPLCGVRSIDPEYANFLPHQLPMVYGYLSIDGYDPVTQRGPAFQQMLKALGDVEEINQVVRIYGIRWGLYHNGAPPSPNPFTQEFEMGVRWAPIAGNPKSVTEVENHPELQILEFGDVEPLVHSTNAPKVTLPFEAHGKGIDVDVSSMKEADTVIVSFLHFPTIHADIDGKPVQIAADEWSRMTVEVPKGAKSIRFRCEPAWVSPCLQGLAILILSTIGTLAVCRLSRRSSLFF